MSNENGNGHGTYEPKIYYRYLDADVWTKENIETGEVTIAYSEDVKADLFGETDSDDNQTDNGD